MVSAVMYVKFPEQQDWQVIDAYEGSELPSLGEYLVREIDGTNHAPKVVAVLRNMNPPPPPLKINSMPYDL